MNFNSKKFVGLFVAAIMFSACGSLQAQPVSKAETAKVPTVAAKQKAIVYYTKDLSAQGLKKIYAKVNQDITGKTAIKLHTGEPHGPYILPREWVKELQADIPQSTLVETKGMRQLTYMQELGMGNADYELVEVK